MKRSSALAQCLTAGVVVLAMFSANHDAHAQSADLVSGDRLAADPADPDKPADVKGVVNLVLIASPERIVLGGGVMQRECLFPKVRAAARKMLNGYIAVGALRKGEITPGPA